MTISQLPALPLLPNGKQATTSDDFQALTDAAQLDLQETATRANLQMSGLTKRKVESVVMQQATNNALEASSAMGKSGDKMNY